MEKLVITPKEDKAVTMTIRIDKVLQEAYNDLSAKTNRSRNELICMALQYALDIIGVQTRNNALVCTPIIFTSLIINFAVQI